jgi:hypothetical protein
MSQQVLEILLRMKADTDKALKELGAGVEKVEKHTNGLADAFSGLSGGAFQFNQITDAAGKVISVVSAVAGGFMDLAERGGRMATVSASFDQLAGSAANANAILQAGREGTLGLVSDFDLMLSANKMLALGLPTTAEGFRTLTEGAGKLGAAVGITASEAMNRLIEGLGKGSAEMLDELSLVVRAEDAYKSYAASIGVAADQLTAKQKQLAVYEEGLRQVEEKVGKLADRQLTFADRVQQVRTQFQNFVDTLGIAIARSPVLNELLGAIAGSMQQAFGANQTEVVRTLIGAIDSLAIGLVTVARIGVEAAGTVAMGWQGARGAVNEIIANMYAAGRELISTLQDIAAVGGKLPGQVGAAFRAGADDLARFNLGMKAMEDRFAGISAGALQSAIGISKFKTDAVAGLQALEARLEAARSKVLSTGNAFTGPGGPAAGATKAAGISAEQAEKMREAFAKAVFEQRKQIEEWNEAQLADALRVAEGLKRIRQQETKDHNEELEKREKARREADEQALRDSDTMRKAMRDSLGQLADALAGGSREVGGFLGSIMQLGADAIGVFLGLENRARTTAERIAAAANAIGAATQAFNSGSFLGGAGAGAAAGAAFGPWGAAVGGVVGGLLGIFGGAKKAREEMQKLMSSFVSGQGGMNALITKAKEAGVALDAMFKAKSAAQLQQAIEGIQAQLGVWQDAQDGVREAAERYGLTIAELGPKFAQQELDKMALQLLKDYELLKVSGADMTAVIAKMGPDFAKYVQEVVKGGGTIPSSMKAIIDQLLAEGKLVDVNGQAYKTAEEAGIKYGQSQSEMFETQLEYIKRMVEAIERLAGIRPAPIRVPIEPDWGAFPGGGPGGQGPRPPKGGNLPEGAGGFIGSFPATGGAAILHNTEAVVPLSDPRAMSALGQAVASAMAPFMAPHGGGGTMVLQVGNQQFGRIVSSLARSGEISIPASAIRGQRGILLGKL